MAGSVSLGERRAVLLIASLSAFLTPFMASSINVALPSIGKQLGLDAVLLSWVATSYLLAAAVFLVPFGRLADIQGRKRIFALGVLVYAVSSLVCGLSTSAPMLLSFRAVQGVGGAMIFGTGVALLTSVYPPSERGRVLGINVAAVYLGGSVGPLFGGLLTDHFGWRSVFLTHPPLGLLIFVLTVWKLKGEWAGARGEEFDLAGSLIYGVSVIAGMYGLSQIPAPLGIGLLALGLVGAVTFVRWEMRVSKPVLDIRLFRNAVFAFSNLAALVNYSATAAVSFLLSLYLQYIKGLSPERAGLVLMAQPAVQAILSPLAGTLSDKLEPRIVASFGMAVTAGGLTSLVFLGQGSGLPAVVGSLMALGFGFALFSSPNTNAVMGSVERRSYGVASATLATMRLMGQVLSLGIATVLFSVYIGNVEITPDYYPAFLTSMKVGFIVFALLCLGGLFASLARGKVKRGPSATR